MFHLNKFYELLSKRKLTQVSKIPAPKLSLLRRFILTLILLILVLPTTHQSLKAQNPFYTTNQFRTAYNFEQITVSTVSIGFTAGTILPTVTSGQPSQYRAEYAVLTCEDNGQATAANTQIRYRADGTAPTASVGHIINKYDVIQLYGYNNIKNFRMIKVGTTDVICDATYYRFSSNAS